MRDRIVRNGRIKHSLWNDWRWQIAESAREPCDLVPLLGPPFDLQSVFEAAARFPLAITPYYFSLLDLADPADPIRRMAVPDPKELCSSPNLAHDPIGERERCPVPGVIRRYPDRALLLVSGRCAVYCRHCTRRHLHGGNLMVLDQEGIAGACEYLRATPQISDVILSGGDPLMLEDDRLLEILAKVRAVPSVQIVRIGTRAPVTLPMRVTKRLARELKRFCPLYVNTQFNHPREITPESCEAVSRLVDAGIPVANQAVLLAGVNDRPETIEQLCRKLLAIRVRPYYLFLCDLWQGLEHLRTPLATGIAIMEHLRGRMSGMGIPQLVADLPGGIGKVPINPEYIVSTENGRTILRAPDGRLAVYPDPTASVN
jgi:lysine 2,3-aminomutase